ncbi:MAG: PQQ-binding-like beta-propeller repeat protein [Bradyrhizobium sp.]|uniref:outer membrane protein assembly factor BamB family protein n=1 Tax=Bradyrhizobium sp. TaxID=376 RepID=UPI001DB762F4|nr:PQQ-binding-like beta-propeller repeat protein [Bradyrhizobium sp.]MBV9559491.1 PQQ-binding-like beta-propeller repeat protein [Bradyrhizobium sp.]
MSGPGNPPFGSSSWPILLGNAGNTGVASVAASLGGATSWSVSLDAENERGGYRIVVGEDGSLFVVWPSSLLALDPTGEIRWRRPRTGEGGLGTPMALADGSIILTEDGGRKLLSRDQATGNERWSIPGRWAFVTAFAVDAILAQREPSSGNDAELHCLGASGQLRWSYPLLGSFQGRTLVTSDRIVVANDGYLTALDFDGNFCWRANPRGFVAGDPRKLPPAADHERFWTEPMRLDERRIIIGYSHYDGHEFLIVDPVAKEVTTPDYFAHPSPPVIVTPGPEPRLVGHLSMRLRAFDTVGTLLFERRAPWEILNIVADSAGNLIVAEGVEPSYWSKYKDAYSLHDACGLVGFDAKGDLLFRWTAPGPMDAALAIGRLGEIYCISEGRLWAVR